MAVSTALQQLHWLQGVEPVRGEEGPLPARAEVAIVGGGYVGGGVAYWLAKRGVAAVLLERRGVATGATGRNAGFIAPGLGMAFAEAVQRYGHAAAIERLEFTRRGRAIALGLIDELGIDCDLEAQGGLTIASAAEEWQAIQASGEALQREGFPYRLLSHDELREQIATEVPASFLGALYNPETVLVNPAKLSSGVAQAARRLGARIYTGAEVFAFSDLPNGRIAVETSRGELEAGRVVLATNAWTPLIAGLLKGRIAPVRGQIFATEPAPRVFLRAMSTNWGYEYWSQRRDGAIVLGGARWAVPDRDEGYYAEELRPEIQGALYAFLTGCFPALAGVKVARRWSGIMGFSLDGYPFIGPLPGRERLLVAAGFTGHGGPYWAIAGQCIADLIATGRADPALRYYALDRELSPG
jgi:glycine/D-amino acid oxidase-like deaminating enzyme